MSAKEIVADELAAEVHQELRNAARDREIRIERFEAEELQKQLTHLREKVKDVKNFWPVTLLNHPFAAEFSASDRDAISYLKDVELVQDAKDPRPFEVVFHFSENPYFSNTSLTKTYKLPKGAEAAPADGSITEAIRDFEPEELVIGATKIEWKDDEHNLTAKQPRKLPTEEDDDDDDFEGDFGSFFHFFEAENDPMGLGFVIQEQLLPNALGFFTGDAIEDDEGIMVFDDDELDEEDEDEEEEIDLEVDEPPKKKAKK